MNSDKPYDSAKIEFDFNKKYRERVVTENAPDSWIEIIISLNSTYIYSDKREGVTGFACAAVRQFLDSVDSVLADERHVIEFEFGPSWLALDPRDRDSISVVQCTTLRRAENPSERRDIFTPYPVTKQAWITGVLKAAKEFHERVLELNPELEDRKVLKQIREKIAAAEQSYRESNLS